MTTNEATPLTRPTAERPFQFRLTHLLGLMFVIGLALGLFVVFRNAVESARESARESFCRDNMRLFCMALQNYHDAWNSFPPARYEDASGKPMHSWRVLIMPFYEASPFPYNFSEPWDGPNNSKLANFAWKRLRCPCEEFSSSAPWSTNYVAVVGPGTIWPDGKSVSTADITDGASNTLMIVEISHSDIHWMEPRDLPIEELDAWLDPAHKPQLLGNHIEGGMVAYADGHVEMLSRDVTIKRLRALVSRAGNDMEAGRAPKP